MATKKNSKKTNKTQKSNEKAKKDFQWTDDEAELLLSITYNYKTAKAVDGVDWESIKSKYEDILELNCPISHRQLLRKNALTVV